MTALRWPTLTAALVVALGGAPRAQEPAHAPGSSAPQSPAAAEEFQGRPEWFAGNDELDGWNYGSRGLQYRAESGRFYQWFTFRNQFRFFSGAGDTPTSTNELDVEETDVELNRSRLKFGGFLGSPAIENFVEIDLKNKRFYHFYLTVTVREWLEIRGGQWKVEFNRERVTSSGEQQLVDRSIVNEDFTLDGQIGVMAKGRLFEGAGHDSQYFLGVFAGEGRLSGNDDDVPMYLARYQWNPLGRDAGFSETDVDYHPKAAGTVGVAVAGVTGRHTRFSSDGGANLDGFEEGQPGQYRLRQWMTDTAWFARGLSVQGEHHWKRVVDRVNGTERRLRGGYAMTGYFPFHTWPVVPPKLEVAGRVAYVDPDVSTAGDLRTELSGGVNWYFNRHRNKVSFDIARLTVAGESGGRIRLQWEVSI
jgi:phosphate-selective porin OprO/OprP